MLRVTRQTDYAVVLLSQFVSTSTWTARELSERTGVTSAMVSKILKLLTQAEILVSQLGVKGGYSLSRPAAEISVADIVTALEGPLAITSCSVASVGTCEHENWCPCRPNWQRINDAIRGALEAVTLEDMADPGNAPTPAPSLDLSSTAAQDG